MSLKNKVITLILIVFVIYGGLSYGVQQWFVLPSFETLEEKESHKNMERVVQAIERELRHLSATAADWATWDDTYAFAGDRNPVYREANLYPEALRQLQLNYLGLFTSTGQPLWSMAYDLENKKVLSPATFPARYLTAQHPLLQQAERVSGTRGLLLTEHGPLLVAARPILASSAQGPARGVVVMGRFLNAAFIANLAEETQVNLHVTVLNQRQADPAQAAVLQALQAQPGTLVLTDAERSLTYSILADVQGQNALLLQITAPRTIYAQGLATIHYALLSLGLLGCIIVLVLLASLHYLVLLPIHRLTAHVVAVGHEHHPNAVLTLNRRDELGVLAQEFARMVTRLAEARRTLAEQAFQAGVAEMAGSVLKDIGDAMTPLKIRMEKLLEVVHRTPVAELQQALTERADSTAASAQRRALEQLVDLTGRELAVLLPRVSRQLSGMTQQVEDARKILDYQAACTRHLPSLEPVAVADLVQDALAVLGDELQDTTVELSPQLAAAGTVLGHRVALQQVLVNLLKNAAESVRAAGLGPTGRLIVLDADPACGEASGAVHLRVFDSGVGINPSDLRRIFQRGFSTKKPPAAGLGLHWSMLTVAAMEGRLYAQSRGVNQGACLHLILRRPEPLSPVVALRA